MNELTIFNKNDDFFTKKVKSRPDTVIVSPPKMREIPAHMVKYENAEKMANDIVLEKWCRYHSIISGSFIAGDFIEALIVSKKLKVAEMWITTLSLSADNVISLQNFLDFEPIDEEWGHPFVKKLNLIISDYFYSHERKNLIPLIYDKLASGDRFQLAVAGTHCKTALILTECGLKIVVHGSANLRSSGNIEQLEIEENECIFDFQREYMENILTMYSTIKKPLRHIKLWNEVNK